MYHLVQCVVIVKKISLLLFSASDLICIPQLLRNIPGIANVLLKTPFIICKYNTKRAKLQEFFSKKIYKFCYFQESFMGKF